jgi:hypothetical protein
VRLAACWLSIVVAATTTTAGVAPTTFDAARAGLAEKIEAAERAGDPLREELAERALSELREELTRAGVDRPLVQALVPDPDAGHENQLHPLARLRRQERRLSHFVEAVERRDATAEDTATLPVNDARRRVETILAQPMFRGEVAEPGPLQRARHWVHQRWRKLLNLISGVVEANSWLALTLFGVVVLAALAALGVLIVRTLGPRSVVTPEPRILEPLDPLAVNLPDWLARARAEAEAGRCIEALKLLVLAATHALRSRGTLPDEPGLTDLEGLRILEATAPVELRGDFGDLTALHDRGVYGGQGADGAAVERAMRLARRIIVRAPEVTS